LFWHDGEFKWKYKSYFENCTQQLLNTATPKSPGEDNLLNQELHLGFIPANTGTPPGLLYMPAPPASHNFNSGV
jgi:hypothetical protein